MSRQQAIPMQGMCRRRRFPGWPSRGVAGVLVGGQERRANDRPGRVADTFLTTGVRIIPSQVIGVPVGVRHRIHLLRAGPRRLQAVEIEEEIRLDNKA